MNATRTWLCCCCDEPILPGQQMEVIGGLIYHKGCDRHEQETAQRLMDTAGFVEIGSEAHIETAQGS